MNLNWKLILGGGLAWFLATFVVSFATGPLIHQGVLEEAYRATASVWRHELMQQPPDMAALMPRWIATGVIASLLTAVAYGWVRPALTGPGWMRGVKFGVIMLLISVGLMLGWSGVFKLPKQIWIWWTIESAIYLPIGGAALGWVAEKLAPVATEGLAAHPART